MVKQPPNIILPTCNMYSNICNYIYCYLLRVTFQNTCYSIRLWYSHYRPILRVASITTFKISIDLMAQKINLFHNSPVFYVNLCQLKLPEDDLKKIKKCRSITWLYVKVSFLIPVLLLIFCITSVSSKCQQIVAINKIGEIRPGNHIKVCIFYCTWYCNTLRYNPEGCGFISRWCHSLFCFIYSICARIMTLGSTQPITEMSIRNIYWG